MEARWKPCPHRHPRFRRCLALSAAHPAASSRPPRAFSCEESLRPVSPSAQRGPCSRRTRRLGSPGPPVLPQLREAGSRLQAPRPAVSVKQCRAAALPPSLPPSLPPAARLRRRGWRAGAAGPPSWPTAAAVPGPPALPDLLPLPCALPCCCSLSASSPGISSPKQ